MPTIQNKRGTAANLASINPLLLDGELVIESDTNKIKCGNGVYNWNDLNYINSNSSGIIITNSSGNFTALNVNGIPVSVSGHTHTSSDITNFNSSVSGLLPTISNSGNNRVLTSTGSSVGINAESNLTFDGNLLSITGSGNFSGDLSVNGSLITSSITGSDPLTISTQTASLIINDYTIYPQNDIDTSSNIRLSTQIADSLLITDSNQNIVSSSSPTLTELSYVSGVTSNIQTQLNNKQNTLTNPVTGTGVANHIPYWSSSSGLLADSNQLIWDSTNNRLGIGTTSPSEKLDVNGNVNIDGNLTFDSYTESVVSNGNSGTSKTLDLTTGTVHTCTLTGNCVFTMPTATAGKSFTLFLNTGVGNFTATFSGVRWADSATPTATILANKVDIYSFISDGTYWYGSFSQNYG